MAVEHGDHDMNKANAARLCVYREARHQMPARMSVVTFSAFANLDS